VTREKSRCLKGLGNPGGLTFRTNLPLWPKMGLALGAGLIIILGLFTSCTPPATVRETDTLVAALPYEPATLNPVFLSDHLSYTVSAFVSPGLMKLDGDLNLKGDLAESWEISGDGREIRFRLRSGVKWHDGREFAADDVVYTYQLITSGKIPTPHLSHFGPVREVKALDPLTVAVIYDQVYSSALQSWTMGLLPRPASQKSPPEEESLVRTPPGTGPYRVKEWLSGQKLVLEAHKDYYAGPPRIRTLILRIIPDAATAFMELKSGNLDVMELTPSQYAQWSQVAELKKNFTLYRCPSVKYGFLGFNHRNPRFQEPRVRQALGGAIDKEAIVQKVLHGLGRPATGPYPPGAWYHPGDLIPPPYDPQKAQEVLRSLGWYDAIKTPEGKPAPLKLVTNYESKENLLIAEIIQDNWKRIGVPLQIEALEWLTFRFRTITQKNFDLVLLSRHYIFDPDLYDVWHSSKTGEGEWNFLSYHNAEVDRLLKLGRCTLNQDQRKKIYRKINQIMTEDPPCVFLYDGDAVYLARKDIREITPSPLGIFYNVSQWYISGQAAGGRH
jgi:peptide/nickel transport system substrate-binding protein